MNPSLLLEQQMPLYQSIMSNTTDTDTIYTVSQLNGEVKILLEEGFRHICLMGEISNLARPASGHFYLTLKDELAQVRCALFRNAARGLSFTPENGQQVIVHAKVSLYEARGDFQLILTNMELAGTGALQIAFDKLKKKLDNEGLFDESHKQPIPPFIQTLGVITSASGAALRDILHVLKRRCPQMRVIIYPTLVQGNEAKQHIVAAIEAANRRAECDALVLARGGGSLEDLWPFNEEVVARAIFKSELPIVSGVGHEVDFTIADFVADLRAPTPSAAAELVSPDMQHFALQLQQLFKRLTYYQNHSLQQLKHQLHTLIKRLRHPRTELNEVKQALKHQLQQLNLILANHLQLKQSQAQHALGLLLQQNPITQVQTHKDHYQHLGKKLITSMQQTLHDKSTALSHCATQLEQLSPLQTLTRGYSIATRSRDNHLIRSHNDVQTDEAIKVRLSEGHLIATVTSKAHD